MGVGDVHRRLSNTMGIYTIWVCACARFACSVAWGGTRVLCFDELVLEIS